MGGIQASSLEIVVAKIEGNCPVFSVGDTFSIRGGYVLEAGDGRVCMHGLSAVLPFYAALSRGIEPGALGLSGGKEGAAYIQCPDPCSVTGGGTVLFEIRIGEAGDV